MSATSISVSSETRDRLMMMRIEEGHPNMNSLLKAMLVSYRKERFLKDSLEFRKRMDERGYSLKDLEE